MLIKASKGTARKVKVSHQWICTSKDNAESICLGISNTDFHVTVTRWLLKILALRNYQ